MRARSGRATRPALLRTWGAFCQRGDASDPHGGRLLAPVEAVEACGNSRRTGPMTARPASAPARYSAAIEVAGPVCADSAHAAALPASSPKPPARPVDEHSRPRAGIATQFFASGFRTMRQPSGSRSREQRPNARGAVCGPAERTPVRCHGPRFHSTVVLHDLSPDAKACTGRTGRDAEARAADPRDQSFVTSP